MKNIKSWLIVLAVALVGAIGLLAYTAYQQAQESTVPVENTTSNQD
ncbi:MULTISPECIES: hypothetical protein [Levilactobacillus]|uniref:Methanol dehydrogenase n=1 Tax=Levilactobacillus tongjiangensis TaxID=2486023 RepID=A0ABW1SRP9_9LACO|nr:MULTISPECIES: hypothetical protein [Levilactobacillus]